MYCSWPVALHLRPFPEMWMENGASDVTSVEARVDRLILPYSAECRWCGETGERFYHWSPSVDATRAAGPLLVQYRVPLSLC